MPALDEHTYNVRSTMEGKVTVQVEGNIQGFEVRDPNTFLITSSRYTNASEKWSSYVYPNLASNAESIAGVTLNPSPANTSIGVNDIAGTINYHFEYDNRPTPSVSGCISQNITLNNHNQVDIFASIPVLGRTAGPVLQDIVTNSAKKRQLQIELVMLAQTQSYTPSAPDTDAVVAAYIPGGTVFLDQDDESWSPNTGRYTRSTSWTWE